MYAPVWNSLSSFIVTTQAPTQLAKSARHILKVGYQYEIPALS